MVALDRVSLSVQSLLLHIYLYQRYTVSIYMYAFLYLILWYITVVFRFVGWLIRFRRRFLIKLIIALIHSVLMALSKRWEKGAGSWRWRKMVDVLFPSFFPPLVILQFPLISFLAASETSSRSPYSLCMISE